MSTANVAAGAAVRSLRGKRGQPGTMATPEGQDPPAPLKYGTHFWRLPKPWGPAHPPNPKSPEPHRPFFEEGGGQFFKNDARARWRRVPLFKKNIMLGENTFRALARLVEYNIVGRVKNGAAAPTQTKSFQALLFCSALPERSSGATTSISSLVVNAPPAVLCRVRGASGGQLSRKDDHGCTQPLHISRISGEVWNTVHPRPHPPLSAGGGVPSPDDQAFIPPERLARERSARMDRQQKSALPSESGLKNEKAAEFQPGGLVIQFRRRVRELGSSVDTPDQERMFMAKPAKSVKREATAETEDASSDYELWVSIAADMFANACVSHEKGAKELARNFAVSALNELRLHTQAYLATPEFKNSRQLYSDVQEPRDQSPAAIVGGDAFRRTAGQCAIELEGCAECGVVPVTISDPICKCLREFPGDPAAAQMLLSWVIGAVAHLKSKR